MALLLKAMSVVWGLLGLINLVLDPGAEATAGTGFYLTPRFNAFVFLGSAGLVFVLAFVLDHRMRKLATKRPAHKNIDPKNEVRLRELRQLRGRGLVKGREYRRKRDEILKGL